MKNQTKQVNVQVQDFDIQQLPISIVGISPLIVHRFSEKAMKMIEDKQGGKAKNKKHEDRDPQEEFQAAKHLSLEGWEGFPASGFKAAMIRGAKMIGLVMKDTQTGFFVKADCEQTQLVKVFGEARLRKDHVRIGQGSADIRYRPEYTEWYAELNIEYNKGILSPEQIYQLVRAAGYGCGVGEMRPEKGKFNYGRFKLANQEG